MAETQSECSVRRGYKRQPARGGGQPRKQGVTMEAKSCASRDGNGEAARKHSPSRSRWLSRGSLPISARSGFCRRMPQLHQSCRLPQQALAKTGTSPSRASLRLLLALRHWGARSRCHTLAAPPGTVPESAALTLLGVGVAGFGSSRCKQ